MEIREQIKKETAISDRIYGKRQTNENGKRQKAIREAKVKKARQPSKTRRGHSRFSLETLRTKAARKRWYVYCPVLAQSSRAEW